MEDLISRDALLKAIRAQYGVTDWRKGVEAELAEAQPAVDPVHAAGACYCRECERFRKVSSEEYACYRLSFVVLTRPKDFCSHGKLKTGGNGG